MKKLFLILFLAPTLLFAQSDTTRQSFKVIKNQIRIKVLSSLSNTVYLGDNLLVLEGVDSATIAQYKLSTKAPIAIYFKSHIFHLPLWDGIVRYGYTFPGKLTILISKIQGSDTAVIGQQTLNIALGTPPTPKIMIGKTQINPAKVERNSLLRKPSLSYVSSGSDYSPDTHISHFDITIGNTIFHCPSASLTTDAITALKKYKGKYVSLSGIYISWKGGEYLYP
jgi:hypothetical protein